MASARSSSSAMNNSSSSSHAIKEPVEETLRDVFRCFICMEKLCEAHLCPHCSKLCCYACISKWLTERRRQCPHCRTPLHVSELVNCRWFEDIAVQVESLQQICANIKPGESVLGSARDQQDLCRTHQEKLSVYCWTCKVCICHQCALFGGHHDGHTFQKLELVYETHISQVKDEVAQLQQRLQEFAIAMEKVEFNVMLVRDTKEERVKEIRGVVDQMIGRLDAQLKIKLMTLMRQKRVLAKETEQLQRLAQEIDYQVETFSQSQLINKSPELLIAMQAQLKSAKNFVSTHVTPDFTSELIPQYDSCTFLIERFTMMQLEGLAVYSKNLVVNGLCWRLKVYPYGNGPARGEYLSVFLELSSGPPGTSKYEYRVQMLHENASKLISREFVSDFEIGECWGYNRFFPLDLLASEGYLNTEKDSLELRFQVRPSTYFQRCRDQQWYIHQLLKTHQQHTAEISELKEQLDREQKQNMLLQSRPPHVDTQCLLSTQPEDVEGGPRSLPIRSSSQSAVTRRRLMNKAETTNEIFSEILKCLSPNINRGDGKRPHTAPAAISSESSASSTSSASSSQQNDQSPSAHSNHSMDLSLLTESSDEDVGAVGGGSITFARDKSADDLARQLTSLDALSLGSSASEDSRPGGFDCDEDELPITGENLIEYSEVLVPATKKFQVPSVEETDVLLNLLVDVPSSSSQSANNSLIAQTPRKGNRLSYCQPIKSTSVLETLLEPPRISSKLVASLWQTSSGYQTPKSSKGEAVAKGNNSAGTESLCDDDSPGSSGSGSNGSSCDSSASVEVDLVLSNLCKNMLLLNKEQQQSTNGNLTCDSGALASASDPGPMGQNQNFIDGSLGFLRIPGNGSTLAPSVMNVDWSLFNTSAASPRNSSSNTSKSTPNLQSA